MHIRGSRGPGSGDSDHTPPPKNHKAIWFLSNTGPDPLENHKATKTAFNVGPSSARWWGDDDPLLVVFVLDPLSPHQLKNIYKNVVKIGPPLTKLSGSTHDT